MSDFVIETQGLTKVFTDFWGRRKHTAVKSLDLQIERGEVFGFLGPNGSGKTTTMKMLLGLLYPTSGTARVLGKDPAHIGTKERIGFLPEESYLYRFLTAVETLEFYGKLFGIPRADRKRRAQELLEIVGLKDAMHRPVREYSKGMARRVGIAQALINDPEVVFLDEPTSGLDPLVSRRMKDLILDLKRQGKTVFMSSHLLADIEDVCDRVGIMHLGELRANGPLRDMIRIQDKTCLVVHGLAPNRRLEIAQAIEAADGLLEDITDQKRSLEDLFLGVIGQDKEDGRR
ncbi:MAG: ABC transporter ATP-binding protein [Candidatus Brocadiae bacterium]|nr:ABC transporter ATP-binding protein [Candidatus Brocadiia bacterium]